jgi:chromosome segregation ATPase
MWPQIEAMDVFSAHPQRPHFLPLREFSPTMREGMALGLMDVFPDLVRNIKKASIDNNMEWFEDKFSTLRHLEGHGFSVQSLHSTLTKLVKIKSQDTICLGEMDKLDVEIEVETASLTRMGALLDEKDSSIAELEQKLGALRQETQKIAAEMETKGTKLLRLKSKHSKFKEAYGAAKLEFHSVLAAL